MNSMTICDDQVTRLTASDGPPVFLNHDDLARRMAAKAQVIEAEPVPAPHGLLRRAWAWITRTGGQPCSAAQLAGWVGCDEAQAEAAVRGLTDLGYITPDQGAYRVELPLIIDGRP
jgi:hypothetical protein